MYDARMIQIGECLTHIRRFVSANLNNCEHKWACKHGPGDFNNLFKITTNSTFSYFFLLASNEAWTSRHNKRFSSTFWGRIRLCEFPSGSALLSQAWSKSVYFDDVATRFIGYFRWRVHDIKGNTRLREIPGWGKYPVEGNHRTRFPRNLDYQCLLGCRIRWCRQW